MAGLQIAVDIYSKSDENKEIRRKMILPRGIDEKGK